MTTGQWIAIGVLVWLGISLGFVLGTTWAGFFAIRLCAKCREDLRQQEVDLTQPNMAEAEEH